MKDYFEYVKILAETIDIHCNIKTMIIKKQSILTIC
jgi:hypothetical protein